MHCSSFMVGALCLSINLHEAGRIEAGGCGKPTSHCQTVVLVMLTRDQLVYRFYRFFTGFYSIYRACIYLHDRQFLVQSFYLPRVHLSIGRFGCKTKVAFVPIAPPVRGVVGQTANGWFARYFKVVF